MRTALLYKSDLDGSLGHFKNEEELFEAVLRPVGAWRFLTPLEKIQEGDLVRRAAPVDEPYEAVYKHNWTRVNESHIGETMADQPYWEVIRPMDENATAVRFFSSLVE